MNTDLFRFRLPADLSARLRTIAAERCRTASDVSREALVLHLDDLDRHRRPANDGYDPQQAA